MLSLWLFLYLIQSAIIPSVFLYLRTTIKISYSYHPNDLFLFRIVCLLYSYNLSYLYLNKLKIFEIIAHFREISVQNRRLVYLPSNQFLSDCWIRFSWNSWEILTRVKIPCASHQQKETQSCAKMICVRSWHPHENFKKSWSTLQKSVRKSIEASPTFYMREKFRNTDELFGLISSLLPYQTFNIDYYKIKLLFVRCFKLL